MTPAEQKFIDELTSRAQILGWQVSFLPVMDHMALAVRVECSHGQAYEQTISFQVINMAPATSTVDSMFAPFFNQCQAGHQFQPLPKFSGLDALLAGVDQPSWMTGLHPVVDALASVVPGIRDAKAACPKCEPRPMVVISALIIHMNDQHLMTRNEIADFLDSLEDVDLTIHRKEVA